MNDIADTTGEIREEEIFRGVKSARVYLETRMPAWPLGHLLMTSEQAGRDVLIAADQSAPAQPGGCFIMKNFEGILCMPKDGLSEGLTGPPHLPCRGLSATAQLFSGTESPSRSLVLMLTVLCASQGHYRPPQQVVFSSADHADRNHSLLVTTRICALRRQVQHICSPRQSLPSIPVQRFYFTLGVN